MAGASSADPRSDLAHLYRRAAFGALPAELDAAVDQGYDATVDQLLGGLSVPGPGIAPPATSNPRVAKPLVRPWLDLMIASGAAVRERLTLFWHGHFATSDGKVQSAAFMSQQNNLFRQVGGGSFETLVGAVTKDPAMLVWLDGNSNVKAHPNENLARELMELFTLGVGNYTETDVHEAARCLTGWRVKSVVGASFSAAHHDAGRKTVLGQSGNFGSDDLVRLLVRSDASAHFVAARMYTHYGRPVLPSDPVVADLARAYVNADRSATELLRAIFRHPDFLSPATRTGLVKTPVEWVVGTARAVQGKLASDVTDVLSSLGQLPFYPPSVGGWGQNRYWLSTAANLVRLDFAATLAKKADLSSLTSVPRSQRVAATAHLLSVDGWSPSTADALGQAADSPQMLFALAATSPEYLLA